MKLDREATVNTRMYKFALKSILLLALLPLCSISVNAQEKNNSTVFDVKNTFRNICGFCHQNYGRQEGKGPQLMGSEKTDEQLFDRIKNGKPGRMAAFGVAFTDEQIWSIVKFIRSLKPGVEPENP